MKVKRDHVFVLLQLMGAKNRSLPHLWITGCPVCFRLYGYIHNSFS